MKQVLNASADIPNSVRVKPAENGSLITQSSNPEYGWITVTQERMLHDDSGFIRPMQLNAFVKGTIRDLRQLGWKVGMFLPGKILVQERLTSFSAKMPEKELKIAGKTGVVCTFEEQPIYRRTIYCEDASRQDEFIQHDNKAEIKARHKEILYQESLQEYNTDDFELQQRRTGTLARI